MVSANHWLRGIKTYRLSWHLTRVSANQASSNWALNKNQNSVNNELLNSTQINGCTKGLEGYGKDYRPFFQNECHGFLFKRCNGSVSRGKQIRWVLRNNALFSTFLALIPI